MKQKIRAGAVVLVVIFLAVIGGGAAFGEGTSGGVFDVITIDSAITPAVADYVTKGIERSRAEGAAGVIILLDTPGGLDLAMRDIVKELLTPPCRSSFTFIHRAPARRQPGS